MRAAWNHMAACGLCSDHPEIFSVARLMKEEEAELCSALVELN